MLQHTALEVVASPAWQRHLRHLRAELGRRRDVLVEGVRAWLPDWEIPFVPRGGLSLWVKLPAGTDDRELALAAARAGVEVFPGRPWFAAEPPAPFLRLSFASAAESQLADGVERLARAAGAD
jgi:DNA-binding transcriptional MocR family regulator